LLTFRSEFCRTIARRLGVEQVLDVPGHHFKSSRKGLLRNERKNQDESGKPRLRTPNHKDLLIDKKNFMVS
jgi:hypothetical protein